MLEQLLRSHLFAGKQSSEDYGRPGSVRDTMHAKVVVVDDVAFVGSFNLSRSGENNAENTLEIEHRGDRRVARDLDRRTARALPGCGRRAAGRRGRMSTRPGELSIRTLDEGGQSAEEIGGAIAAWIGEAHRTLDLALYDVRVPGPVGDTLAAAIEAARARGVRVRIAIHDPRSEAPDQPTTPPQTRPDLLASTGADVRLIDGDHDLMHHKFVVRDGAALWCGSTNWTIDSWTREENVIVTAVSQPLAQAYERTFEELWRTRRLEDTGDFDAPAIKIGDALVRPWFCPGRGRELAHQIATRIDRARRRIRIASPVLTSAPVLAALAEVLHEGRVSATGDRRHHADRAGARRSGATTSRCAGRHPCSRRSSRAWTSTASARRPTGPTASTTSCTRRSR